MPPTLAGFILFIRNVMGISTAILPDNSIYIGWAFSVALALVNPQLECVAVPSVDSTGAALGPPQGSSIYSQAVYNLAADNLINYAQDLPNAPVVPGSGEPGMAFFAWTRKQLNINGFVSGVIQSTADQGSSSSFVVQEAAKAFTLGNLQNLKTTYGRTYLAFTQSYGPSTWGMS